MTVEKNNKLIQSYNSTQSTKALDSSTMTRDTAYKIQALGLSFYFPSILLLNSHKMLRLISIQVHNVQSIDPSK